MSDLFVYTPVFIGIIFGALVAYIFKLNSKPAVNNFTKMIFNISSHQFINVMIISMAATFFIIIATIAMIIRDTQFINANPGLFIGELCFAGLVPAALVFISTFIRDVGFTSLTYQEYLLLASKFAITHVLFQLSGYYSYIFPKREQIQA